MNIHVGRLGIRLQAIHARRSGAGSPWSLRPIKQKGPQGVPLKA